MSYSKLRDQKVADEYTADKTRCKSCQSLSAFKDLTGGMCYACFQHYCDPEPNRGPPLTLEQKRAILEKARGVFTLGQNPGRQCAETLRARLKRDGKLGPAQRAQLAALEGIGK